MDQTPPLWRPAAQKKPPKWACVWGPIERMPRYAQPVLILKVRKNSTVEREDS